MLSAWSFLLMALLALLAFASLTEARSVPLTAWCAADPDACASDARQARRHTMPMYMEHPCSDCNNAAIHPQGCKRSHDALPITLGALMK